MHQIIYMTKIKLNLQIFYTFFHDFLIVSISKLYLSTSSILDYGHGVDGRYVFSTWKSVNENIITSSQDVEGKEYKLLSDLWSGLDARFDGNIEGSAQIQSGLVLVFLIFSDFLLTQSISVNKIVPSTII